MAIMYYVDKDNLLFAKWNNWLLSCYCGYKDQSNLLQIIRREYV